MLPVPCSLRPDGSKTSPSGSAFATPAPPPSTKSRAHSCPSWSSTPPRHTGTITCFKARRSAPDGLLTASLVFGLAAPDTSEQAIAELGCTALRFRAPVHHGDTVEAFTEVLETTPSLDRDDAGVVRFKHWGRRHDNVIVFEGERTVLIKRKQHWSEP